MTIIAAMREKKGTWILGADSLVTEETIRRWEPKMHTRRKPLLAWGFSGCETVGVPFGRWLQTTADWDGDETWPSFTHKVSMSLSMFNGERRKRARLAGLRRVEKRSDIAASVLMIGSVGGSIDCWELTDNGGVCPGGGSEGIWGIGSGWHVVKAGYLTAVQHGAKKNDASTFARALAYAAKVVPMCGPPIHIVRLSNEGIVKLKKGPGGKWIEGRRLRKP